MLHAVLVVRTMPHVRLWCAGLGPCGLVLQYMELAHSHHHVGRGVPPAMAAAVVAAGQANPQPNLEARKAKHVTTIFAKN